MTFKKKMEVISENESFCHLAFLAHAPSCGGCSRLGSRAALLLTSTAPGAGLGRQGRLGVFGENITVWMVLPAFRSADGQAANDKTSTTSVLLFSETSLQPSQTSDDDLKHQYPNRTSRRPAGRGGCRIRGPAGRAAGSRGGRGRQRGPRGLEAPREHLTARRGQRTRPHSASRSSGGDTVTGRRRAPRRIPTSQPPGPTARRPLQAPPVAFPAPASTLHCAPSGHRPPSSGHM